MARTLKLSVSVEPYEVDGNERADTKGSELVLKPHWNLSNMIVVKLGEKNVTVSRDELERAVRACAQ